MRDFNKNKEALVSIIVPVYNIKEYIERCINGLITQTYGKIEIVVIDDGSSDGSSEVCDRIAIKDSRVRVIHKQNGGLSDARNIGIDESKGEYITFVDGDDWVTPYYIEHLVDAIESDDSDISMSWYKLVFNDKDLGEAGKSALDRYEMADISECFRRMIYQEGVDTNACGKLYKKSLFNDLRFPVGKLYEDIVVVCSIIVKCHRIAIIKNIDYFYFQRSDSIQYQKYTNDKMYAVESGRIMVDIITTHNPKLYMGATTRYFNILCNIIFQITDNDKYYEDRKLMWNEIKSIRKTVIMNREASKKSRIAAGLSYLGYPIMKYIYLATQKRAYYYRTSHTH